jgi:sigma-B regulation protein RsbU (phosphoserine phosphatase)
MEKPVEQIAPPEAVQAVSLSQRDHDRIRSQLSNRRIRVSEAMNHSKEPHQLAQLLKEIDGTLERLDAGTYGICMQCNQPIGTETLRLNPLARICLDHLGSQEQQALERDLELASTIQAQLLPRNSMLHAGWEFTYHYQPAGTVSGDYCDALPLPGPPQSAIYLVGDVSGKGVAASLLMSQLHAILRTLVVNLPGLQDLLSRANRMLAETTLSTHFATLVSVEASDNGNLRIANAGHCRPLLVRRNDTEFLESTGLPLGLFYGAPYTCLSRDLAPGESIILYTDGLSETRNLRNEEYGEERLALAATAAKTLHTREMLDAILEDLSTFRGAAPPLDDLTLMVVRRSTHSSQAKQD